MVIINILSKNSGNSDRTIKLIILIYLTLIKEIIMNYSLEGLHKDSKDDFINHFNKEEKTMTNE